MQSKIEAQIVGDAAHLASGLAHRKAQSDAQYRELEQEMAKLKLKSDALRLAPQRHADFQVSIAGRYQCPRCWIEHGKHSNLTGLHASGRDEHFHCDSCGWGTIVKGS